ncbi:MAG: FixG Ig-like domain-containing protein, partial [Nanoarchaeota archaeon]
KVSIPELGISASDFIDELEADDKSTTSEELYMRIPTCTEPGLYDVKVTVTYDDGDEIASTTEVIEVREDESCGQDDDKPVMEQQTVITVPRTQSVAAGQGAVYPVTISNTGSKTKTYALTVSGIDAWGTYRVDPSNVVVVPAESAKTVFVYVNANEEAATGAYTFGLTVTSGEDSKVVNMEAVVSGGSDDNDAAGFGNVKKGLEIALVVLVVVLVILGLIIGFNKLRGDDNDDDEETQGQTYY